MKFIDLCKALSHKAQVELIVFSDDMESEEFVGTHSISELVTGSYWKEYQDYYVISVTPTSFMRVKVKVAKE